MSWSDTATTLPPDDDPQPGLITMNATPLGLSWAGWGWTGTGWATSSSAGASLNGTAFSGRPLDAHQ